MSKKPLYFGDPNATMTICVKKMRRHLRSDLQVFVVPALTTDVEYNGEKLSEEAIKKVGLDQPTFWSICKHCKQSVGTKHRVGAVQSTLRNS
jgi:hypothetical protein